MRLAVHEERISNARPLLSLLPRLDDDRRFAFVEGDDGVVGWGVAERIPVGTGPERFSRARDALCALTAGTPAVAFVSFAFDEDDDESVMVVPQVTLIRRDGSTRRITVGDAGDVPSAMERAPVLRPEYGSALWTGADRPRYSGSTVRDERWLDAVATALDRIHAGELEKVVLARDLHLWSRGPFDTDRLLAGLVERFPSCMTFLIDHLFGASPELLLSRDGAALRSRVLAGTAPRGADEHADSEAGAALLTSAKDRHEHDLALRSAVAALTPVCTELMSPAAPSLLRLDNVQHLASELIGTLRPNEDTHVLTLLARLHPTAAVGGMPREPALATIRELEGMSRGRYSGPVGWCTPDGDGAFAIALRCGEVRENRARLFAGAGVVTGSLPEDELAETWLKLRAMMGVLGA